MLSPMISRSEIRLLAFLLRAVHFLWDVSARPVNSVVLAQDRFKLLSRLHLHDRQANHFVIGVTLRVLDTKLSHQQWRSLGRVGLLAQ